MKHKFTDITNKLIANVGAGVTNEKDSNSNRIPIATASQSNTGVINTNSNLINNVFQFNGQEQQLQQIESLPRLLGNIRNGMNMPTEREKTQQVKYLY